MSSTNPHSRRYPPEIRERRAHGHRARRRLRVRMGRDLLDRKKFGMTAETLRAWIRQEQVDHGKRPGITSAQAQEIKELRRKVKELRRANEILKSASAFFAYAHVGIIGELGYLPMHGEAASHHFQAVSRRYEHGSIVLTTNRGIAHWGQIFEDST